ncbi:hypothetical protein HL667_00100 [Bradyrhizobium sp. 83012]|uniref:Uncharacterized protein n=1 Tax=Bradyrhizobium aeschynomenes TaxID=2734909 RepID=A0ABX2C534_9BRAD|nr:hypothetical protein [Bradyrhizobium aeschynomenes]NPU63396.1 hypothetical protein [Bradyrhizobium aeschynomenes]
MSKLLVIAGVLMIAGGFVWLGGYPVLVLYAGIATVIVGANLDDHLPRSPAPPWRPTTPPPRSRK